MKYVNIMAVVIAAATLLPVTAFAQGASNAAPGRNKEALTGYYGAGGGEPTGSPTPGRSVNTLGGAISGGFYGNTSNSGIDDAPDRGHGVTPSISPGPQTVGGGGPGTGTSVGQSIQQNRTD